MRTRVEIISAARECLGTKWHHQGRLLGVGMDCIGVLVHTAKTCGFKYEDQVNYPRRPDGRLIAELRRQFVQVDTMQLGSILAFSVDIPNIATHVAIRTEKGIVHSYAHVRKCVEASYDPMNPEDEWFGKLIAIFDFPGVV